MFVLEMGSTHVHQEILKYERIIKILFTINQMEEVYLPVLVNNDKTRVDE